MIGKVLNLILDLIRLSNQLNNPSAIIGYLFRKQVRLDLKNGLRFITSQVMDAAVIKDTIGDDSYRILDLDKSTQTILDIGAGLGDFSIFAAKHLPKAKIIAFEPNPFSYILLQKNIRLNNYKNIKSYHYAIGTKKTYLLNIFSFNIHSSTVNKKNLKKTFLVKGKRLESFINKKIDLLKIDCEGAELDILKSLATDKIALISKIVIEYHNDIIQNEDKKILTILRNWGYRVKVEKNHPILKTGYIFAEK